MKMMLTQAGHHKSAVFYPVNEGERRKLTALAEVERGIICPLSKEFFRVYNEACAIRIVRHFSGRAVGQRHVQRIRRHFQEA